MSARVYWLAWVVFMLLAAAYFAFAIAVPQAPAKRLLVPGETTHGHYQIELACDACHSEFMGIRQDACTSCHGEDLERDNDTHPASKFNDPTNADRLARLDVQNCVTCHREHVPDRTATMGLSLPKDYCFHCHEDVAEQRPSHAGLTHDSCATAGCHNYHDNQALYENFLLKNCDQPATLSEPLVKPRASLFQPVGDQRARAVALRDIDADAPSDLLLPHIVKEWARTTHAAAGVNCRGCHELTSDDGKITQWHNQLGTSSCQRCHETETRTFLNGRHGMRLAVGMSPMRPEMARLPMHENMAHRELDCSACHPPHTYDTRYAAVEACMSCHNDEHTRNYKATIHFNLWEDEVAGLAQAGAGVSCATCHMPRVELDGGVHVQHNQNDNLRPNEKMIRSVCMSCHGLEFSLSALADSLLIESCFQGQPSDKIESVQMAKRWFEEKEREQAVMRNRQ